MAVQPFLISNLKGGLFTYYKPWLLPNDAFTILENVYCWRGNLQKRPGVQIMHDTHVTVHSLPAGPVMGLGTQNLTAVAEQDLIAFNLTNAFKFDTGLVAFVDISGATVWTGGDANFFWTTNFARSFWSTNNVDPIRYYFAGTTWNSITPTLNGTTTLTTASIILPYKGRLVALNTTEGGITYAYRARWSQIGNPYSSGLPPSPFIVDANAWRDDIVGRGGFIDLPTYESIISAEFNKDTMIIFCSTSTWKLVYTGNNLLPFVFQQINDSKGAECQFSRVSFDTGVLAISRNGIVSADQVNVTRVDEKIIDFVDDIEVDNNGLTRVQGIRDQNRQFAYWVYPDSDGQPPPVTSPNQVLSYNYQEDSWAILDQAFTVFGKYRSWRDLTWANLTEEWTEYNNTWRSGASQSGALTIVAGDIEGDVYTYSGLDLTTDLVPPTIPGDEVERPYGFNIWTKRFNPFLEQGKNVRLNYVDFYVTSTAEGEFTLQLYTDDDPDLPISTVVVSTALTNQAKYVRAYLGSVGRFHQLRLFLTTDQVNAPGVGNAEFQLQGIVLWMEPVARPNP